MPLPPEALKVCVPRGATVAVAGVMLTPVPTVMVALALLPSESVTRTTSVVLLVPPAAYAPVVELIVAPDPLVISVYVNPVPLPPDPLKARVPSGATLAEAGLIEIPALTVIVALALLPSASVTFTTSVVLPVAPAVYRPLAFTLPPEPLVVSVYVNPVPLPPDPLKLLVPRGATVAVVGVMLTPALTVSVALALLPSESVTFTTSVALAVVPAV